jgi:hypothetical protein
LRRAYPPFLLLHLGAGALVLWLRGPTWAIYASMAALFLGGMLLRHLLARTWSFGRLRLAADDPHGALRAYEKFATEHDRQRTLWRIAEVLTAQRYYLDAGGLVNQGIALLEIEDPELWPEAKAKFKAAHERARHLVEPAAYLTALAVLEEHDEEALFWVEEGMKRDRAALRRLLAGDPQLKPWLQRTDVRARLGIG